MKSLNDIPESTILGWWSTHPAGADYAAIALLARRYEVIASIHQARRHLKSLTWIKRNLPKHRAPTTVDYDRLKDRWKRLWDSQQLT